MTSLSYLQNSAINKLRTKRLEVEFLKNNQKARFLKDNEQKVKFLKLNFPYF